MKTRGYDGATLKQVRTFLEHTFRIPTSPRTCPRPSPTVESVEEVPRLLQTPNTRRRLRRRIRRRCLVVRLRRCLHVAQRRARCRRCRLGHGPRLVCAETARAALEALGCLRCPFLRVAPERQARLVSHRLVRAARVA